MGNKYMILVSKPASPDVQATSSSCVMQWASSGSRLFFWANEELNCNYWLVNYTPSPMIGQLSSQIVYKLTLSFPIVLSFPLITLYLPSNRGQFLSYDLQHPAQCLPTAYMLAWMQCWADWGHLLSCKQAWISYFS